MSEFHGSPIVIKGNGNNVGDNNSNTSIESLNIKNITHVNGGAASDSEGDPRVVVVGAFVAVVVAAWFYLRHFFPIHEVLYLGCFLSVVPALLVVATSSMRGDDFLSSFLQALPTCLIAVGALVVLGQIRDAMPQDILDLAASSSASETWHRLTEHGQRIVLESGGGAVACAFAILLNALSGTRALAESGGKWTNWLLRLTTNFQMGRCAVANIAFLALAWGVSSGAAYDYWKMFQAAVAPSGT